MDAYKTTVEECGKDLYVLYVVDATERNVIDQKITEHQLFM